MAKMGLDWDQLRPTRKMTLLIRKIVSKFTHKKPTKLRIWPRVCWKRPNKIPREPNCQMKTRYSQELLLGSMLMGVNWAPKITTNGKIVSDHPAQPIWDTMEKQVPNSAKRRRFLPRRKGLVQPMPNANHNKLLCNKLTRRRKVGVVKMLLYTHVLSKSPKRA